ncbi:MAG: cryptochrome/photolyase family protein [Myxococcota bacterium]|nr:cryptochrome/photolyase family protein [Myxococcota bacterium]
MYRRFLNQLANLRVPTDGRTWFFVAYDQLNQDFAPWRDLPPASLGFVFCETQWKPRQRAYHKQKLALLLSNQRHFALEQAERGVAVHYVMGDDTYAALLRGAIADVGPLRMMEAAERELRVEVAPLVDEGLLRLVPHDGWLTTKDQFVDTMNGKVPWRMDAFYRGVRQDTGILMTPSGKPVGGQWSFDHENRKPWKGTPAAPTPLTFEVDAITQEVCDGIEQYYAHHPGTLQPDRIPATLDDAKRQWAWAQEACMTHFGTYEDAMNQAEPFLFHTRISGLMNLHRLLPRTVLADALALDIPLNSKEGFVRQILGWREYCRHVHRATDGFRDLPPALGWTADNAGDSPSFLGAHRDLPPVFWGEKSGLNCLDHAVGEVWEHAYSHHINRLMILSNWATLLDISPRALTDWFWVGFEDAYDWVVEPNVLGMGTFAVGTLMVTKPYVSGSAYVNKMSDYCRSCQFNPKTTCPMTGLYWQFINRHREVLRTNPRMRMMLSMANKRSEAQKEADHALFEAVWARLTTGETIDVHLFELAG